MNTISNIIGIILIVVGVAGLGYSGFTYTSQERVAEVGPIKVNADTEKTVRIPPIVGGICLVLGIGLIVFGRKR